MESLVIRGHIDPSKLKGAGAVSLLSSNAFRVRRSVTWKSAAVVTTSTKSKYLTLLMSVLRSTYIGKIATTYILLQTLSAEEKLRDDDPDSTSPASSCEWNDASSSHIQCVPQLDKSRRLYTGPLAKRTVGSGLRSCPSRSSSSDAGGAVHGVSLKWLTPSLPIMY